MNKNKNEKYLFTHALKAFVKFKIEVYIRCYVHIADKGFFVNLRTYKEKQRPTNPFTPSKDKKAYYLLRLLHIIITRWF